MQVWESRQQSKEILDEAIACTDKQYTIKTEDENCRQNKLLLLVIEKEERLNSWYGYYKKANISKIEDMKMEKIQLVSALVAACQQISSTFSDVVLQQVMNGINVRADEVKIATPDSWSCQHHSHVDLEEED